MLYWPRLFYAQDFSCNGIIKRGGFHRNLMSALTCKNVILWYLREAAMTGLILMTCVFEELDLKQSLWLLSNRGVTVLVTWLHCMEQYNKIGNSFTVSLCILPTHGRLLPVKNQTVPHWWHINKCLRRAPNVGKNTGEREGHKTMNSSHVSSNEVWEPVVKGSDEVRWDSWCNCGRMRQNWRSKRR